MRKPIGKIHNLSHFRRMRRKLAIRKKIFGTASRPRVCINKTNKHFTAQVVDDTGHKVLFSVQTYGKKGIPGARGNKEGAKSVGTKLAKRLKEANINSIILDRAGFRYTGVITSFAEAVRGNGINF